MFMRTIFHYYYLIILGGLVSGCFDIGSDSGSKGGSFSAIAPEEKPVYREAPPPVVNEEPNIREVTLEGRPSAGPAIGSALPRNPDDFQEIPEASFEADLPTEQKLYPGGPSLAYEAPTITGDTGKQYYNGSFDVQLAAAADESLRYLIIDSEAAETLDCQSGIPVSAGENVTIPVGSVSGDETILHVISCDIYGNISPKTLRTYTYDSIAPQQPTASAVSHEFSFAFSLTLSVASSNTLAPEYIRYTTDGTDLGSCSEGNLYSDSLSIDATTTFKAIACDQAGNQSMQISHTYTKDTTPPAPPSVTINGGDSHTNLSSVNLNLGAADADEMYITNTAACASGGAWESYSPIKSSWALGQSNSTATVYVKYRDIALNESTCESDTIIHDGSAPSVTGVNSSTADGTYGVGSVIDVQVTFNEIVHVTGVPTLGLVLDAGTQAANYTSGSGSATLSFHYTVAAGDDTANLQNAGALNLNGGTIRDTVSNNANLVLLTGAGSLGNNKNLLIDTSGPTSPTISIAGGASHTNLSSVSLGLGAVEATEMYITNTAGCGSGGAWEIYSSSKLSWPLAQSNATATIYVKYRDAFLNESTCENDTIIHDNIMPAVTNVDSITPDAPYGTGSLISVQVNYDEAVIVTGTPTLGLVLDDGSKAINYTSGSGTSTLTFDYTVVVGDDVADLQNGASLSLNGGTILDLASNNAGLTLPTGAGSLSNNKNLLISTSAPTAVLSGIPNSPTPFTFLNVTVGGADVVNYKYKIVNGTSPCTGGSYSSWIGIGTPITDTISIDGDYKLCVIGQNLELYAQLEAGATIATWTLETLKFSKTFSGSNHNCGLTADGSAYCWGLNNDGQLGDGTTSHKYLPASVVGGHKFTSLDIGQKHTCGLKANGTAYCWGLNNDGQLGLGDNDSKLSPSLVPGHTFENISTLWDHTCGLKADGQLYCWGANTYGQLGDGSSLNSRNIPVPVSGHVFKTASVGHSATCALKVDGKAYCWGKGDLGIFGDGTTTSAQLLPSLAAGGEVFESLGVGLYHACGLKADGRAFCWGTNHPWGMLGNNSTDQSLSPVQVAGGHLYKSIHVGNESSCGLKADGKAYCWGKNSSGGLADGTFTNRLVPTPIAGGHTFESLSLGWGLGCAVKADSEAYCWGWNFFGAVGDGSSIHRTEPTLVPVASSALSGLNFAALAVGGHHSCGLKSDGQAYCWGDNPNGALGNGSTSRSQEPAPVVGGHVFKAIYTEQSHSCGLKVDGRAYCWGGNQFGQLGAGDTLSKTVPSLVVGGQIFTSLALGGAHTCGLTAAGVVSCWGYNDSMQLGLGDGDTVDRALPSIVAGGQLFKSIELGADHSCGLKEDGSASCWGSSNYGQVGDGTQSNQGEPVSVEGGHRFKTPLSLGSRHSCGLKEDGSAYCWGSNDYGQLGLGHYADTSQPTSLVIGGHTFASLANGYLSACGLTSDAQLYCWGSNDFGQLGLGDIIDRNQPALAATAGKKFDAQGAGLNFACGLTAGGKVFCWGDNEFGQLGDGSTMDNLTATSVNMATAPPLASISGGPDLSNVLDVTVGGEGILDYQYKMVLDSGVCTGGAYNGSWISIDTKITASISTNNKLCVIARDAELNEQTEANATERVWPNP